VPYNMKKQGSKWCVFNKDTGENKGCSDTRAMAVKHMRALYANAGDKSKDYHPDAGYINSYIDYCNHLIETAQYSFQYNEPEHEELATFSERLIDDLSGYLEQLNTWRNDWYGSPDSFKEDNLVDKAVDKIKSLFGLSEPASMQSLTLTKQADGRTRVLLRVSNIFKDRHGEIITEAAHKEYEAYVNESKAYPEFWLWHTPGSRWGQADLVSYDDGFLTMSGLVDQGKEYIAEALVAQGEKVGVSHGFKALSIQGKGYIDWYRTFEASPLPLDQAANVWTGMMLAKEWEMGLADKQKKFFETIGIPETIVQGWDSDSKQLSQKLKDSGIEFKDMESLFKDTEPPEPAPQPQPEPPAPQPEPSSDPVLAELKKLNERFDGLESKQKELESKVKDSVADTIAAAVIPGAPASYVASKQGEAPSDSESQANKQWEEELISLILGAK
jgi:hypothetical protein